MPNVFPRRLDLEILHIGLEHLHLDAGQAEHGSVIVDELSHKRSRAPESLRLLLDGGRLLGREPKGLRKVVVSCGRFGHWISLSSLMREIVETIVNPKMDFNGAGFPCIRAPHGIAVESARGGLTGLPVLVRCKPVN